jgi:hypothetical protein
MRPRRQFTVSLSRVSPPPWAAVSLARGSPPCGAWKFGTGAAAHGGGSWRCFVRYRYLVTHFELEPAALAVAEVGEGEEKERKKEKRRAWALEGRSVTHEQ